MMPRILFVDDEQQVLDGLKDGLRRNRSRWEMCFALGADDALLQFDRDPHDVVVSDMRMPGMDGAALLERIRDRRPLTGRIVLSGQMDRATAVRSATSAHRVLAKPCDKGTLEHAIEAGVRLSVASVHPTMKAIVGGTMRLPSPPLTYLELSDAMKDPDVSVTKLTAILERDAAMTAQVLRVVNSPFFGVRAHVSSVSQAISMLGMEMLKNLVLGVDVFRSFKALPAGARLATETHHDHSILVARISSIVAPKKQANAAFTAGMLHDLGVLLVSTMTPDTQYEVLDAAIDRKVPPHVVEKEMWGTTHAELGAYLLGLWGLPGDIIQAVADHHDPPPYFADDPQLSTLVHVADAIAHEQLGGVSRLETGRLYALGIQERLDPWRNEVKEALRPKDPARSADRTP